MSTLTPYAADAPLGILLVLAHGAGAGQGHPFMRTIASGLAARGVDAATFDFPYMRERRRVPDRAPVLEAAFREAIAEALERFPGRRTFAGGKSMGGRIATHLAAQAEPNVTGVVALGYPLHPPGKPEQLRIAHLPGIRVPMLVVQGEFDPFGAPSELEPHLARVPGDVTLHVVAGGDHSLGVRKRGGAVQEDVHAAVLETIAAWTRRYSV